MTYYKYVESRDEIIHYGESNDVWDIPVNEAEERLEELKNAIKQKKGFSCCNSCNGEIEKVKEINSGVVGLVCKECGEFNEVDEE